VSVNAIGLSRVLARDGADVHGPVRFRRGFWNLWLAFARTFQSRRLGRLGRLRALEHGHHSGALIA
jgi:hypothetical protein